jgi:hypothetical protein
MILPLTTAGNVRTFYIEFRFKHSVHSMKQSPSCEGDSCLASQEIPTLILFSHINLGLTSGHLTSGLMTKIL